MEFNFIELSFDRFNYGGFSFNEFDFLMPILVLSRIDLNQSYLFQRNLSFKYSDKKFNYTNLDTYLFLSILSLSMSLLRFFTLSVS